MAEYIYGTDEQDGHWLTDTEIVRCKDCRFYEKGDSGWWCMKSITLVPDTDGFCAWGERKVVEHG